MAANRERGEVSVTIDGTVYTFVLNTAAMIAAESEASTTQHEVLWDEVVSKVARGSAKYLRLFIWAMLQKHHPGMSVAEAGEVMDAAGGPEGLKSVMEAGQRAAVPDARDVEALGAVTGRPRKARSPGIGGKSFSPRAE